MRNISVIVTKDHFVFTILADYTGDEITISEFALPYSQNGSGTFGYDAIGFGVHGSGNTFLYSDDEWIPQGSYTFPILESRYNANTETMIPFGALATSNDTIYVGVVPKEDAISPPLIDYTKAIANTAEVYELQQNTNTAFQLFSICQFDVNRDVNTFEKLETIEQTIPDSEVTII